MKNIYSSENMQSLILPRIFGLLGVEMTQAVADILSVSVSIPLAASELRKMERE